MTSAQARLRQERNAKKKVAAATSTGTSTFIPSGTPSGQPSPTPSIEILHDKRAEGKRIWGILPLGRTKSSTWRGALLMLTFTDLH
ncbi:hypothetical protein A2U01_0054255, partial [Trifolium medium]|nr:hypothetical protein [Trifolium medium]